LACGPSREHLSCLLRASYLMKEVDASTFAALFRAALKIFVRPSTAAVSLLAGLSLPVQLLTC
jgi:hypothetical protein